MVPVYAILLGMCELHCVTLHSLRPSFEAYIDICYRYLDDSLRKGQEGSNLIHWSGISVFLNEMDEIQKIEDFMFSWLCRFDGVINGYLSDVVNKVWLEP